jgi:hypothetical protein
MSMNEKRAKWYTNTINKYKKQTKTTNFFQVYLHKIKIESFISFHL